MARNVQTFASLFFGTEVGHLGTYLQIPNCAPSENPKFTQMVTGRVKKSDQMP